jgi:hypothetical protein
MLAAPAVAAVLTVLGLLLLLHHGYKHARDVPNSLAHEESCAVCCYFQKSDVANHETWILVCFTNAITILILSNAQGS